MEFLDDDFTVLLFYQYCHIEDPAAICQWQEDMCQNLGLKGRVRVASEGINGTVAGCDSAIQEYITSFHQFPELRPESIHWKTSKATKRYKLEDQQFLSLSCKVTKEVVSLDLPPVEQDLLIAAGPGEHLTPLRFHDTIAAALEKSSPDDGSSDLVLVDVRNVYETAIGRFECPAGIPVLDPKTRKFKDFKEFVDANKHELKLKKVLMYCTGGVRCERASAYMRLCGVQDVNQLSGGIHAYQEAFPNGDGFFRGKNFVYDRRIAVPHLNKDEIIGECRKCGTNYDDYKPQVRCVFCRMLQLVCDNCRKGEQNGESVQVVCELCADKGRVLGT